MTFAIVFGVILYRISIKAALHMSTYPAARSNIRATVKTTAAIINLIVIIILDEIYGSIARWLTTLGEAHFTVNHFKGIMDSQTTCWLLTTDGLGQRYYSEQQCLWEEKHTLRMDFSVLWLSSCVQQLTL